MNHPKPNNAGRHLAKRILRKHLPDTASLEDYEAIIMMNPEERLQAYEVDVTFPDVSGMEHIEMFYNRSSLADVEENLSIDQKERLVQADHKLLNDAYRFHTSLRQIVNLKAWREQEDTNPEHWWWYLDVIASLPFTQFSQKGKHKTLPAAKAA